MTPAFVDLINLADTRLGTSVVADGVTHVSFNIFPDGGVTRLRLMGRPT